MKATTIGVVACLLALAATMHAEIRPSFDLNACSWFATHVVVVTEGEEIDGKLTVLESWKGDLEADQTIVVPELAAFRAKESRLVSSSHWKWYEDPPPTVTGTRMLLFLKEKTHSAKEDDETSRVRSWEAANDQEMKVSVLWVDDDQPFAFIQVMNPGDAVLVGTGESETEIQTRFVDVDKTHESLGRALGIAEPAARAEALAPFTASELFLAQDAAFAGLRECGRAALPVLKRLLQDQARMTVHGKVIRTMSEIGGDGVGEELTAVVREELIFWKATAPGLKAGWWNEIEEPETNHLRERYGKVHDTLYALQKLRFAGCIAVVTELRDFWRSLPQLEGENGRSQIRESCDAVLSQLE